MTVVIDFSQVRPAEVYTTRDVAALLRVSNDTVLDWIDRGALPTLPRMLPRSRYRILGSVLLSLAGVRASQPAETPTARSRRAAADRDAIRRMK